MTAETNRTARLTSAAGLPSHADALANVDRARRLRAETLARLAHAALSWMRHRADAGRPGRVGGMPHAHS